MWLTGVPGRPIWGIHPNLDHCARNRQEDDCAGRRHRRAPRLPPTAGGRATPPARWDEIRMIIRVVV
jgi:hypothetical protein